MESKYQFSYLNTLIITIKKLNYRTNNFVVHDIFGFRYKLYDSYEY